MRLWRIRTGPHPHPGFPYNIYCRRPGWGSGPVGCRSAEPNKKASIRFGCQINPVAAMFLGQIERSVGGFQGAAGIVEGQHIGDTG